MGIVAVTESRWLGAVICKLISGDNSLVTGKLTGIVHNAGLNWAG